MNSLESLPQEDRLRLLGNLLAASADGPSTRPASEVLSLAKRRLPSIKVITGIPPEALKSLSKEIWTEIEEMDRRASTGVQQLQQGIYRPAPRPRAPARRQPLPQPPATTAGWRHPALLAGVVVILAVWAMVSRITARELPRKLEETKAAILPAMAGLQGIEKSLAERQATLESLKAPAQVTERAEKEAEIQRQSLAEIRQKLASATNERERLQKLQQEFNHLLPTLEAERGKLAKLDKELEDARATTTEKALLMAKLDKEGTYKHLSGASSPMMLPSGVQDAFEIPAGDKDAYGNPIRKGTDAKTGLPLEIRHKATGMHFVFIPAGEFTMGSPENETGRDNDETEHTVGITAIPYLSKYETTQGEWTKVMESNPSHFKGDSNPVEQVSWDDCDGFIKKLNAELQAGNSKWRIGFPTEAQWEYACRAGARTRFSFGDQDGDLADYAWFTSNSGGQTHQVGQKKPNAWGLYDMHGNVWEWCEDWYGDYPTGTVRDTKGPTGGRYRVIRGGSWVNAARGCRSAFRDCYSPDYRDSILGCRLALRSSP